MHNFSELINHCTAFTLHALAEAENHSAEALNESAATVYVKALQMIQLQRAVSAVGMFSIFEAMLQDQLHCSNGFKEANTRLDLANENSLKEKFNDFYLAINVLKHGRGTSYNSLAARADKLPFRIKLDGEEFFDEGDVSEVRTLILVDDAFVLNCAQTIHEVSAVVGP